MRTFIDRVIRRGNILKRSTFIYLGTVGVALLKVQLLLAKDKIAAILTPMQEWDKWATDEQKEFARRCIRYGEQQDPRRGHTLAGLAWMESSLGLKEDHGEPSYGEFGMSLGTANHIRQKLRKNADLGDLEDWDDATVIDLLENDFEYAADLTLFLFEHHRKWFIDKKYSEHQAWKYAAQKYAGWKKWAIRKTYGDVFNARVKFLKTIKVEVEDGNPPDR